MSSFRVQAGSPAEAPLPAARLTALFATSRRGHDIFQSFTTVTVVALFLALRALEGCMCPSTASSASAVTIQDPLLQSFPCDGSAHKFFWVARRLHWLPSYLPVAYGFPGYLLFYIAVAVVGVVAFVQPLWYQRGGRSVILAALRVMVKAFAVLELLLLPPNPLKLTWIQGVYVGNRGLIILAWDAILCPLPLRLHIPTAAVCWVLITMINALHSWHLHHRLLLTPLASTAASHAMIGILLPTLLLAALESSMLASLSRQRTPHPPPSRPVKPKSMATAPDTQPKENFQDRPHHTHRPSSPSTSYPTVPLATAPPPDVPPAPTRSTTTPPDLAILAPTSTPTLATPQPPFPPLAPSHPPPRPTIRTTVTVSRGTTSATAPTITSAVLRHRTGAASAACSLGGSASISAAAVGAQPSVPANALASAGSPAGSAAPLRRVPYTSLISTSTVCIKLHHHQAYEMRDTITAALQPPLQEVFNPQCPLTITAFPGCLQLLISVHECLHPYCCITQGGGALGCRSDSSDSSGSSSSRSGKGCSTVAGPWQGERVAAAADADASGACLCERLLRRIYEALPPEVRLEAVSVQVGEQRCNVLPAGGARGVCRGEEGGDGLLTRGAVSLRRVALQPPCLYEQREVDVEVLVEGEACLEEDVKLVLAGSSNGEAFYCTALCPAGTQLPLRLQSTRTLDAGPLEVYLVSMHPGREGALLGSAVTVVLPVPAADEVAAAAARRADGAGSEHALDGLLRDLAVAWRLPTRATPAGAAAGLVGGLLHHLDAAGMGACHAALARRVVAAAPSCSSPLCLLPQRCCAAPAADAASGNEGEQERDASAAWQEDRCARTGAAAGRLSVACTPSAAAGGGTCGEQHKRKSGAPGSGGRVAAALPARGAAGGHGEGAAAACSARRVVLTPGGPAAPCPAASPPIALHAPAACRAAAHHPQQCAFSSPAQQLLVHCLLPRAGL